VGLLLVAASLAIAIGCQSLGVAVALAPFRKSAPEDWAERARLTYPALGALGVGPWILGFISFVFAETLADRLFFSGVRSLSAVCMAASVLAAAFVAARIESILKRRLITLRDWFRHELILGLLFLPHIVVLFSVAFSMPDQFTYEIWTYVLIACAGILFYLFAGGLFVARLLGFTCTPPERLGGITRTSAERLGIAPVPNYLLRWKYANAVAFPLINRMAFSDTALAHLADEELRAICVHEFGHLMESRAVKFLRILSTLTWLPVIFVKPIVNAYGFTGLAITGVAILIGFRAVRALVLAMEKRADALARAHEGEPGTYARALERLYQLNLVPAVTHDRRPTHPHLYDRLVAAHVVPSYPRPKPPSRLRGWMSFLAMLFFGVFLWLIVGVLVRLALE
jgi:Zn-dependent protease with chaperone function